MEPTKRRAFVKTLGLAGLVAVGVKGYQEATKIVYRADEFPSEDLEKQLEKKPVLQLQATYGTPKPRNSNSFYVIGYGEDYVEGTRKDISVQIVPGPDGKLYVKENDTWRKV
jgi:hypothetical protein